MLRNDKELLEAEGKARLTGVTNHTLLWKRELQII